MKKEHVNFIEFYYIRVITEIKPNTTAVFKEQKQFLGIKSVFFKNGSCQCDNDCQSLFY